MKHAPLSCASDRGERRCPDRAESFADSLSNACLHPGYECRLDATVESPEWSAAPCALLTEDTLGSPSGIQEVTVPALRILIVDDYEDNGTVLSDALESRGHATMFVGDATSALGVAAAFRPDLAILDIVLPDMNGYELGRRLVAVPGLERLCLIAITGMSRAPTDVEMACFHGHVLKPITLGMLEAEIEKCLAIAGKVPS